MHRQTMQERYSCYNELWYELNCMQKYSEKV